VELEKTGQRREPSTNGSDVGSAAHAGLEVLHTGGSLTEALSAVTAYCETTRAIRLVGPLPELSKVDDPLWYKADQLARTMVEGYQEWLEDTGFDAGFKTLAVEHAWEAEIPGTQGAVAYGKIDLVGHDAVRGGTVVDDNKSVKTFETVHPINFQLLTYAWGWWRSTGDLPVGAGHRQLRRVGRGGNSKPPFYDYVPIHLDEETLLKHEQILSVRALDILEARGHTAVSPRLYSNPNRDCSWDCDFKSICPMVDQGDDFESVLELNFTVKSDNE